MSVIVALLLRPWRLAQTPPFPVWAQCEGEGGSLGMPSPYSPASYRKLLSGECTRMCLHTHACGCPPSKTPHPGHLPAQRVTKLPGAGITTTEDEETRDFREALPVPTTARRHTWAVPTPAVMHRYTWRHSHTLDPGTCLAATLLHWRCRSRAGAQEHRAGPHSESRGREPGEERALLRVSRLKLVHRTTALSEGLVVW